MLCPTWRKNSGRNSTSHNATNGSGLRVPTSAAVKEENRSPTAIEDTGGGAAANQSNGAQLQNPLERSLLFSSGATCRGSCEVTLRRKSGDTLGLGIAGGLDKQCPPTISCLRPGGIAHRSDCLQVGDLLVAVNGVSVFTLKHEEILTVLRNAGEKVVLSIEYDLNHPCFDRPPGGTTVTKTCLVRLEKEGGGLGITVRGGAYGPDETKSRPLTVTAVRAGGPAHRDGRIRVGDRLGAINGIDMTTSTLRTAFSQIDRASECVLTVDYDVSVLDAVNTAQGPLLLEIDKPAGEELGVALNVEESSSAASDDQHAPVRRNYVIGAICASSIGDRCGALYVGDQLLSVDGVTLEYTTLAEAYQLLKGNSTSQNIRVEIVPRYLRGLYAQQERERERMRMSKTQSVLTRRSSKEEAPEYAVIVSNSKRNTPSGCNQNGARNLESNPAAHAVPNGHCNDTVRSPSGVRAGSSLRQIQNGCTSSCSGEKRATKCGSNKKSQDDNTQRNNHSAGNGNGRGRKLSKQQQSQQLFSAPHLITSASEKCKKGDRRHSSVSSKTGNGYRGRSASAVGTRHGTPAHDLLPLPSGSLTASVSAVPCGQVCHSDVMEIVLNCWARGGYGLILHRNQSISDQQQYRCPLFVSYVERGSPADKSGVIQVGDRVLAINDWCTENGTAEEANYMIRHATGPLTLTIEFDVIDTVLPSSGVFTVKLAKRGQNLGIVLQPANSSQKGDAVVVCDVRSGSVAHRCGTIHPGDQILAIDNMPLDACTVEEASRLLHRASDIVKLRIKKNLAAVVDEYDASSPNGSQTVIYTVELSRKNAPLGLTIAGSNDRCDPIFVSQLAPGGLADTTGAVRVGDRIMAINGQSLQGKRVSEALQILQQAGDAVSLKIARCVAPMASSTATTPTGPLSNANHSRALFHSTSCNTPAHGGSSYLPHLVTLGGGMLDRQTIFHDHDAETSDKLGTPVQSIDSAVESLEDSPLNDSQHPSTGSNRTSQNSKSSSLSGAAQSDGGAGCPEDFGVQLHRTLTAMKNSTASQGPRQSDTGSSSVGNTVTDYDAPYTQLGGETCPCVNYQPTNKDDPQAEWIRVLEALETVGEAEMLKKLEESILAGSVPACSDVISCETSNPPPKPPLRPGLTPPFPLTNTILRHPYSNRLAAASGSSAQQDRRRVVASTKSGTQDEPTTKMTLPNTLDANSCSASCPTSKPLSISTIFAGYEHIPFITTPLCSSPATVPKSQESVAASSSSTAMVSNNSTASEHGNTKLDRQHSPAPSSIQLSGSATPSETAPAEYREQGTAAQALMSRPSVSGFFTSGGRTSRVPLEIYQISLMKDKVYNDFGFSVSDGLQQKGVYINKVRTGGPADSSGNIKPFDRILQVNGTSLQDLDCMLAVPVLAAAGDRIDILICRDPLLAVSFRGTDSIVEEDEDETVSLIGQTTV